MHNKLSLNKKMTFKNIDEFSFNKENKAKSTQKGKKDIFCSTNSPTFLKIQNEKNKKIPDKDKMTLNNINLFTYHNKKFPHFYNPVKLKHNEINSIRKFLTTTDNSNLSNNENNEKLSYSLEKLASNYCKNLFKNKYIRECSQRLLFNQVNITDYNLTCNLSNFGTRNKNYKKNKNSIIIDDSKINNFYNEKNIILNVMETQSKSNFNNKYKIIYRSANSKKRESIQKYFSNIKKKNNLNLSNQNMKNIKLSINIKNLIINQKFNRRNTIDNSQQINYDLKLNKTKKNKWFTPTLSRFYINKTKSVNKKNYNNSMYV